MARILLTGATSGIGLAAAVRLAKSPHDIVLHGPELDGDAAAAIATVRSTAHPGTTVTYEHADFTRLDDVRALAARIRSSSLDVLINNAAIPGPPTRTPGEAGTDLTYQVNFLAGVLLTHLLLPRLSARGRIVNVASATHYSASLDVNDLEFRRRPYSASAAYAQSKLAIVTYSNWLASRVETVVMSLHPGVVSTDLLHTMFSVGGVPASVGGENLASAVSVGLPTGTYLDETTPSPPSAESLDRDAQRVLVADTERRLATPLP
ncbi:SDR family NAD(P)-dependent oxidoreductase [Promicromonospora panici]|uniref:SDR family NAD(P)-dependent oxidoreductase n=1 Tax=Promicromonospora panici TaxID=2219658 RepID=UPI00101D58B1|nr:SDR family NAD(P)-dependent oxidoreductase [Promicromonospora panici]